MRDNELRDRRLPTIPMLERRQQMQAKPRVPEHPGHVTRRRHGAAKVLGVVGAARPVHKHWRNVVEQGEYVAFGCV